MAFPFQLNINFAMLVQTCVIGKYNQYIFIYAKHFFIFIFAKQWFDMKTTIFNHGAINFI